MSIAVELARKEWDEAERRVRAESRDPVRSDILAAQVEAVMDELRRRVGQTFTIAQLAAVYDSAETWSREAVAERVPASGWARTLTIVEGAAFHRYARGAVDYVP